MGTSRLTIRQRILVGDMVLHIAVLGWFFWPSPSIPPQTSVSTASLSLFDAPMASVADAATQPPQPSKPAAAVPADQPALPTPSPTVASLSVEQQVIALIGPPAIDALRATPTAPAAATGSADQACDLTGPVQAALRDDPALAVQAARLPVTTLSIANAFMLWDVEWVAPRDEAARSTIDSIRSAISRQIADAPLDCRDQIQVGPRLIFVGPESAAITLVIGSGFWRWADVEERAPQSPVLEANRDSASDG